MYVDKKKKIAGQPSIMVRDFFKKVDDHSFRLSALIKGFQTTPRIGCNILKKLHEANYIKESKYSTATLKEWELTSQGRRVALASAAKPLLRKTADKKINEFMERVKLVNSTPDYLFKVKKVILFGSYLSNKNKINDIDIAIELGRKISDKKKFEERCKQSIKEAEQNGRVFKLFFDKLCWPEDKVKLFLKSHSRALSLHPIDDGVLKRIRRKKVVFEE